MNYSYFFRFAAQFTLFVAIVAGIAIYPLYKYTDTVFWGASAINLCLFFVLTLASFWVLTKGKSGDTLTILTRFLGGTILKMFISLIYFLIVFDNFKGRELEFALTFFAAYLVCTSFEVYFLLHNLRQN
ncbi:MAG: hypothetical protein M3Q97_07930 [Bacteroidota bacterium]|nr:hypothetical protein [Bacteroidota bacterium]